MIKRAFFLLALLACSDGTGPGGPPAIVFMSFPYFYSGDPPLEIFVMDSLGGRVTNITQNPALDQDPAWSPDGSRIIFSSAKRDTTGRWHLFLMRPDGSGLTALTSGAGSEWGPDWSPDGAKIAFIESGHLSVMNADGTNAAPLLDDGTKDRHPSWSPDGRIVFESDERIHVINSNGTGLTTIDSTGSAEAPAWSRDGSRIAFSSNRGTGNFQIWTMNPDGSNPTRLTSDSAGNSYPAWSPDGSKIVFISYRDGVGEIYVMQADGSSQTRLTYIPGTYKLTPRWRP